MVYIVIPIYSDPFLHPQHKHNKLSLLYIREINGNFPGKGSHLDKRRAI